MAAAQQQSSEGGAPEWMVSYADMITIMMAFFVVLYASTGTTSNGKDKGEKAGKGAAASKETAGAGPKEGPGGKDGVGLKDTSKDGGAGKGGRLDKVFESLHYRFGPDWTVGNCWIGGPPELRTAYTGRKRGPDNKKSKSIWGQLGEDAERARAPKPGESLLAGGRIYFDEFSATLAQSQVKRLRGVVEELAGKMQKIELRGHTSRRPLPAGSSCRDHWDLAYDRCRAVSEFLVSEGIDPRRIRLAVAAENEPLETEGDPLPAAQNSRVDIHTLNEYVKPPTGTREEKGPVVKK